MQRNMPETDLTMFKIDMFTANLVYFLLFQRYLTEKETNALVLH